MNKYMYAIFLSVSKCWLDRTLNVPKLFTNHFLLSILDNIPHSTLYNLCSWSSAIK